MKFILASASPRRQEILGIMGIDFEVFKSDFIEKTGADPYECVLYNAKGKCLSVKADKDNVVISADTVVVLNNVIFGKPKNEEDAFRMIKQLSGSLHEVVTCICIRYNGNIYNETTVTEVKFCDLTDKEIHDYINTKEPLDKAGAYGIQGKGAFLVEKINGCFFNVVGLSLVSLKKLFKKAGVPFEY